jgi:hypothetical protein
MMDIHTILLSPRVSKSRLVRRSYMLTKWAIGLVYADDEGSEHCDEKGRFDQAISFPNDPWKAVVYLFYLLRGESVYKVTFN